MKQVAEFSVFLALATVSHFAVFQGEKSGSVEAMGNAGTQMLTLAASSASLSAMVQEWDSPVEVVQHVTLPEQVGPPPAPVVRSPPSAMPQLASKPNLVPTLPATPDMPTIDMANPPQPNFAAAQSARPKLRPAPAPRAAAKPVAKTQSTSAKRQVAAGAGKGKAAGKKKVAKAPAKRVASSPAAMARWGGSIRSAVERRKTYPANTRARGRVVLTVAVSSSGKLASVRVKRSSGNRALDKAAVAAVKRARFAKAPKGVKSGVHYFSLPIAFSR